MTSAGITADDLELDHIADIAWGPNWRGRDASSESPGIGTSIQPDRPPTVRYHSAREIAAMTRATPDWIVTALVARQGITELDGKIKVAGKTTLATHLVKSCVTGRPFLGLETTRTGVVYLTEQQPGPFREALSRAGLLDCGDELRVAFRREIAHVPWEVLITSISEDARRSGHGLLVVDTLGAFSSIRDENDAGEARKAMAPLQDAAHDGLAVMILRHERKGGGEVGESARGSSAFGGDADVILRLRRPEGNQPRTRRVLESLSRYAETPEKIVIELTPDGYVYFGDDEAVAVSEAMGFASAALRRSSGGMNLVELLSAAEGRHSRTTIQEALDKLSASGMLEITGKGVRGDPKRYRLSDGS
jgi:hypothetical protein